MQNQTSDFIDELISSECLHSFSVIESFCEACGDLTPHHIDEAKRESSVTPELTTFVPPLSVHECVICREQEENLFEDFNS